ncbi:hypothetical protein VNO78_16358 [Psophocarpus tetragonolobus]|uniref:Uncharacterized protein n=1 Tax=Psophocarpus tetragonolobus TaxID=3891 RepID=A0AAN9XKQ3_PSOTE
MPPNPIFLHSPRSNVAISHIPNCNPFFRTKLGTHFFSSIAQPGRFQTVWVAAQKTRLASWWALPELRGDAAEPTAALLALRRMWDLVDDQRPVAFVAVGSLVIAAPPALRDEGSTPFSCDANGWNWIKRKNICYQLGHEGDFA